MIRINLLGEKRDDSTLHTLQLFGFGAAVFATVVGCFVLQSTVAAELSARERERDTLQSQLSKLEEKTKKVEQLEKNKQFLADKLTTIASLKAKRQGPVQLLDAVTQSIPDRAWVTSMVQKGNSVQFEGLAVDPQTVSDFSKAVQSTPFFSSAEISYSRLFVRDEVKLQKFALVGRLLDPIALQRKLSGVEADESSSRDKSNKKDEEESK